MRMFSFFFFVFSLTATLGQLPSQDILALLEFKKGIKHDPTGFVLDSWNDESIDLNGCPSSWNGIICNGGNVAAVVLDNLGLSADVDLRVFSNLTMLVKLSLSNNSISGALSNNFGAFRTLEYLDISDNLFSSLLPNEFDNLTTLKNLSLAGNNFSGPIPNSISLLSSIRSLDMSRNSLSGSLPSSLIRLGELVYLNLSHNAFTKTIPKGLELITHLDVLDLHGNMLNGELDHEFFLLTTASHVDLSENFLVSSYAEGKRRFIGGISPSINYLNLSRNEISGSITGAGGAKPFGSLKVLDLSFNKLSGELPGFNFVYDLQVLRLGNNAFSGSIPNNLLKGDSSVLTELDLSKNNLSGPICMITSTTLHTLNLSSNAFSGELPPLTGSCAVLDLSNNRLQGNLSILLKWGNIEVLDLNQLTGPIPELTAQFLRLNHLNLSRNSLGGSLPNAVALFPKLTTLDLSFNQFDGPVLVTLLSSPTLEELHLQNNVFTGSVDFSPSSDSDVTVLRALDLSDNQLVGSLCDELGSFFRLQTLNIGGNNFSGFLPTSIGNISTLNSLDISRNRLTGPLPTNLPDTLQIFNVSYNDLSGSVPDNLRKFPLSSFFPGNSGLQFPNLLPAPRPGGSSRKNHLRNIVIVATVVSCVAALILLIFLVFVKWRSKTHLPHVVAKVASTAPSSIPVVSTRKETSFSPSKTSRNSWSPVSIASPDRLAGELYFLDDMISFTAEELSRARAVVLGRSSHGTSYKATLENGMVVTVKWLREGVAEQRKEFAKEAKKFSNIRHPNVVALRGYYWGPTQHEKLILSDYISPASLASFLYDRPGRKGPPLTWAQRLKIAVDVARGLNYLHFDRAVPHGNLKATNILLDGPNLNARVADYGLHRLMTRTGTLKVVLDAGALGYRAPEHVTSKKAVPSFKSDVYAFGVIMMELLTGKCAGDVVSGVGLSDWVGLRVAEGRGFECFDAALVEEMSVASVEKGMKEVMGIALRCIRPVNERTGIKAIYEDLSSI